MTDLQWSWSGPFSRKISRLSAIPKFCECWQTKSNARRRRYSRRLTPPTHELQTRSVVQAIEEKSPAACCAAHGARCSGFEPGLSSAGSPSRPGCGSGGCCGWSSSRTPAPPRAPARLASEGTGSGGGAPGAASRLAPRWAPVCWAVLALLRRAALRRGFVMSALR